MVTLDIAKVFQDQGIETVCATFQLADPMYSLLTENNIEVVDVIKQPQSIAGRSFDLIWAHHWPVLGFCIYELNTKYGSLVCSSLSSYEPLEMISLTYNIAHVLVCNSEETKSAHIADNIKTTDSNIHVLKNSLPNEWFTGSASPKTRLSKLAIVSNHVPTEVKLATEELNKLGIRVTTIDLESIQKNVSPELLKEYDAVVSIGHTVQKCLALGIPIFCYDRFGGPGWIVNSNIDKAEQLNFSGRCCDQKLSSAEITAEIQKGFLACATQLETNRNTAKSRYRLSRNIQPILNSITSPSLQRTTHRFTTNNTLRKASQQYVNLKFNTGIPSVTNTTKLSDSTLFASHEAAPRSQWPQKLIRFTITKVPTLINDAYGPQALRGLVLANCTDISVTLLDEGHNEVARTTPSISSPNLAKLYPDTSGSDCAGFLLQLPSILKQGIYELRVVLTGEPHSTVGYLSISGALHQTTVAPLDAVKGMER